MLPETAGSRQDGAVSVRLVLGLLIVALGTIFLADNLGWVEGEDLLRRFWPAAFVTLGAIMLLQPHAKGSSRYWGLLPIVAGLWIYANQEEWLDVHLGDLLFPGLLLLFGGSLVWRAMRGPRAPVSDRAEDPDAYVRSFAVMAGNEVRSTSSAFRGGDLGAFMGGVVIDLTQAKLAGDRATIDAIGMWAGIEIKVPPDWRVVSEVLPLMAAFEDKTRPAAPVSEAAPSKTLVVRGVIVMGGIEVKN
jgi:hypothetical protein